MKSFREQVLSILKTKYPTIEKIIVRRHPVSGLHYGININGSIEDITEEFMLVAKIVATKELEKLLEG